MSINNKKLFNRLKYTSNSQTIISQQNIKKLELKFFDIRLSELKLYYFYTEWPRSL